MLAACTEKELVGTMGGSMHTLFGDAEGHMLLAEPGLGCRELEGDHAVISNFPLLEEVADLSPVWYGKDRYDRAEGILRGSTTHFTAQDGLALLRETRQEGEWATRASFVYSRRDNTVYYVLDNDFDHVKKHTFE